MNSRDIIFIHQLKVSTIIGILPWEQQISQTLILDIDLMCDLSNVMKTGAITDTVDYAAVTAQVTEFIKNGRFTLIEILAEKVAELILTVFKVSGVRLKIIKPGAVPGAKEVGVFIERSAA